MRWLGYIMIAVIAIGCSGTQDSTTETRESSSEGESIPPEIARELEIVARKQSQGLKTATIIVHRVYDYAGYSWIEPINTARLIAVDVECRNYRKGFDLDDIDIIDGESNENYGSDPQIAFLAPDGKLSSDPDGLSLRDDLDPLRVLLIYAFPMKSETIKLGYWGQELTPEPIPIAGDGPLLPEPKPKNQ